MADCSVCSGDDRQLGYQCSYCSDQFCSIHRLPESHNCLGLRLAQSQLNGWFPEGESLTRIDRTSISDKESDDNWTEERVEEVREVLDRTDRKVPDASGLEIIENPKEKPYRVVEPEHTVGTRIPWEGSPSPDVNPDGSIKQISEQEEQPTRPSEHAHGSSRRAFAQLTFVLAIILFAFALAFEMGIV